MTAAMLTKARRNAAAFTERTGLANVEFRMGEIEHLPVADSSVDVVISNCVLNLSPDKPQVWREIARVLKPTGRVAISDLALAKPLPSGVFELAEALVGCVAGAVLLDDVWAAANDAGLTKIAITVKHDYVAVMENLQDPLYREILDLLPPGEHLSDYIVSAAISAHKPEVCCEGENCCGEEGLGKGPGGGDDARLTSPTPEWHQNSSCCGATEMGDVGAGKKCC